MFKRKQSKIDPKKLWENYLKASLKQDWGKAKESLASLVALEPKNHKMHLKMGDLLQKTGDTKGSVESYHRSASLLEGAGFGQKALALYKIILRLDAKDKKAQEKSAKLLEGPEPEGRALPFSPDDSFSQVQPAESSPAPGPVPAETAAPEQETPAAAGRAGEGHPAESRAGSDSVQDEILAAARWDSGVPGQDPSSVTGWPGEENPAALKIGEESLPELDIESSNRGKAPEPPIHKGDEEEILSLSGWQAEEQPAGTEAVEESLPELDIGLPSQQTGTGLEEWSGPLPEIFWELTREELRQIFAESPVSTHGKGQAIVREGDAGDSIYAIIEGAARVVASFGGRTIELAALKSGDVFGEVAFLSGNPRTATVIAQSDTKVMAIGRKTIERAIERHPRILSCLAEYYHNRLKDTLTKLKKTKKPKGRLTIRE